MLQLNTVARVIRSGAVRRLVSNSAQASGSTPALGTAAQAFDGITTIGSTNGFVSTETGAGCIGVSQLTQNFARFVEVRLIVWWPWDATNQYGTASNKVQYSFDGSSWIDLVTFDASAATVDPIYCYLQRSLQAPQWRILCNGAVNAGNRWGPLEIQMYSR